MAQPSETPAPAVGVTAGGVPGVVIDHSPQSSGLYIGSPGLTVLPGGDYLASHDFFGPQSKEHERATTVVFRSGDRGRSWGRVARIEGLFWASLFTHREAAYLLGTEKHHGRLVIRRSTDRGATWTEPQDARTGLLTPEGEYHTAPVPVVVHGDRIWRATEDAMGGTRWGSRYRAMMLSAPAEADLLDAAQWTFSTRLAGDPQWLGGDFGGWLEGNAVVTRAGDLVNILRVHAALPERAAVVQVSADGKTARFDPATGFLRFPGGAKKFTIRFDPTSDRYWSLVTAVPERHAQDGQPSRIRNTLALACSADLTNWEVRCLLLYHPDVARHGFQYVDWHVDGADLIAACRTAYDDGQGGARNNHDANFLTFHRFRNFRALTMADSVPLPEQPVASAR
ncbi:MAG: exo-alpha-sialidase [Verrucomicrobia bacterium]|nr:exo-alpha-sialidase [Verrucomicrobiota bacterium]